MKLNNFVISIVNKHLEKLNDLIREQKTFLLHYHFLLLYVGHIHYTEWRPLRDHRRKASRSNLRQDLLLRDKSGKI